MNATFWAGVGVGAIAVPLLILAAAGAAALWWVLGGRLPRGRVF